MAAQTGIPPHKLKSEWKSSEFMELMVADQMGLVPDGWHQAGTIAAAVHNGNATKEDQLRGWRAFVPQTRRQAKRHKIGPKTLTAEESRARAMARTKKPHR